MKFIWSLEEREKALNMYFQAGKSCNYIAKALDIPFETVKSWCRRYRKKMGIPLWNKVGTRKEPVKKETIHTRIPKTDSMEGKIARLEMEVDLLRNFLILPEWIKKSYSNQTLRIL